MIQICKKISEELSKNGWSQASLAKKSGLKQASISRYIAGKTEPKVSDALKIAEAFDVSLEYLLSGVDASWEDSVAIGNESNDNSKMNELSIRMVPLIGKAHAGQIVDYDEIDLESAEMVPTLCKDPKSFGVEIDGDSMTPVVNDRDQVILMPNQRPHSGSIVVARVKQEGVICRRVQYVNGKVKLIPTNTIYEPTEYDETDFDWIYPVYGTWSQLWK